LRSLADRYGATVASVRSAIKRVQELELVVSRVGSGIYVNVDAKKSSDAIPTVQPSSARHAINARPDGLCRRSEGTLFDARATMLPTRYAVISAQQIGVKISTANVRASLTSDSDGVS